MTKTLTRSPATRLTARVMLTMAPIPTERNGLTLGIVVLKLLAAMNEEKQAPGNAASGQADHHGRKYAWRQLLGQGVGHVDHRAIDDAGRAGAGHGDDRNAGG